MTIEEQLKSIILARYKSVREFTLLIDIPYTTLDSVFKRGISNSGIGTILKIFQYLDLDIESVTSDQLVEKSTAIISLEYPPDEQNLLTQYRQLNDEGKEKATEYIGDLVTLGRYKKHSVHEMDAKQA